MAPRWRDEVANVRLHADHRGTSHRPLSSKERAAAASLAGHALRHRRDPLRPSSRPMPASITTATATPCRRRWCARRSRCGPTPREVRILDQGQEVARHARCYEKGQLLVHPDHHLAALKTASASPGRPARGGVRRPGPGGPRVPPEAAVACRSSRPSICGGCWAWCGSTAASEVLAAIRQALQYQTYDAAYVETLLLARAPPPRTSLAHALATQTPRTDRRHSPGRARPGPVRPAVRRFRRPRSPRP